MRMKTMSYVFSHRCLYQKRNVESAQISCLLMKFENDFESFRGDFKWGRSGQVQSLSCTSKGSCVAIYH